MIPDVPDVPAIPPDVPEVEDVRVDPDLLIDEVRLWDGTGAPVRTGVDLAITGGVVVEVADEIAPGAGTRVIDGAGLTAVPGLIDAHVHLSLDPGGALRGDAPAVRDALLAAHLVGYLACGVTTILDPAVTFAEWDRIDAVIRAGTPGPRYLALGPPLSPVDGYVSVVLSEFPPVADAAAAAERLDQLVERGAAGAKVTVEPGMIRPIWPTHPTEMNAAIRAAAAERQVPLYVHARTAEAQRVAVDELGAHALVHGLDRPSAGAVAKVAAAGTYVMPTLSVLDANRAAWEPERLTDPAVVRAVPEIERATAADRDQVHTFARRMTETVLPRLPAKGLVSRMALRESTVAPRVRRASEAVLAMHEAGVPLVLGSDSGNWPIFPFLFHGPTTLRELELMVEAGLTPEEALTAGTRTAAAMLGRPDLGSLTVGAAADVVLVRGDPLADVATLRDPAWVIAAGRAETPDGWVGAVER